MNQLNPTPYLSKYRHETLVSMTESSILYPKTKISINDAISKIIHEYEPGKFVFTAAGVLEGNEENREANLFNTVFGRDGLIMLDFYNRIEDKSKFNFPKNIDLDMLEFYAKYQGQKENIYSEEEAGKIFHEYRDSTDPIAVELKKERGWKFPYFGGFDTTFHFILQLSNFLSKNPEYKNYTIENKFSNVHYTFEECLDMAYQYTKQTIKDDLVQYKRKNKNGIEIQSWRDSFDSISTHEGLLPDFNQDLALLDLQIVAINAYEALLSVISQEEVVELTVHIASLQKGLNKLWVHVDPENGYYASGIQNGLKFDSVTSSNIFLLSLPYISESHKRMILNYAYPLLKVTNGISTLSSLDNRYHISGYHTGNVWLFDNAYCIIGLESYREYEKAQLIKDCFFTILNKTNCYPELVGSNDVPNKYIIDIKEIDIKPTNRISQPGQPVQGWSVLSAAFLLQ